MKKLSRWILKMLGWKAIVTVAEEPKSIICIAPHTSNWDFILGKLSCTVFGWKSSFLMKKEWFFFPLGSLLRSMGGVPVNRSRKSSVTDQMAAEFIKRENFHLAITPEGTRKKVTKWKRGFYHIAIKANVPIQLGYLDFKKKEMGITKTFFPTGNEEKDLAEIQSFYKGVQAKYPDYFHIPNS